MNRKIVSSMVVLVLATLVGCSVFAVAMAMFSADFTMTDTKGKVSTGKTFVKGEKIRQETTTDSSSSITILRLDKKVSWTLMPDNKQYMEIGIPFDPNHPSKDATIEYESKVIGNETLGGYDCQVIQYTYKNKKYGILVQWVASKLNFAIKYQSKDSDGKVKLTMEYKNIKTGNVADSSFEIPDGYSKLSLPFKLPGMK